MWCVRAPSWSSGGADAAVPSIAPATRSITVRAWRLLSRASLIAERFERSGHGATNSGRAVPISITRAVALCAISRPSSSSDDGSDQCRSSTTSTSGCASASASSHAASSSIVLRRCISGLIANGGLLSARSRLRKSAISAVASGETKFACVSAASIFPNLSRSVSSGARARPCRTNSITG